MSASIPRRRGKVSKNRKKGWKKYSTAEGIEEALEDIRLQERTGGLTETKKDEQLFFVDKELVLEPTVKENAKGKSKQMVLRCHQSLEPDARIPAAKNPVSRNVRVREKVVKVLPKKKSKHSSRVASFDIWAEGSAAPLDKEEERILKITKEFKFKVPRNFHASPSVIPAVTAPHPGISYNPAYSDHQALLWKAHTAEVEKLRREESLRRKLDAFFPAEHARGDTWLTEMSEGIENMTATAPPSSNEKEENQQPESSHTARSAPPKKRAQRKREKELLKEERKRQKQNSQRKKEADLNQLPTLQKSVRRQQKALEERKKVRLERKLQTEPFRIRRLGPVAYVPPDQDYVLSGELTGCLRTTRQEGTLLNDRIKSLQMRNMVEPRSKHARKTAKKARWVDKRNVREMPDNYLPK